MASRRLKNDQGGRKSATEERINLFAGGQKRLISLAQLREAGLTDRGAQHRAESGRLHRLHSGVYATHPPPYSRHQRWLAATLACGPGALLSDEPAALLQDISSAAVPFPAQITVANGSGRSRRGIVVHRRGPVDPRDIRRVEGIPCVSADLVLIQLAPTHTRRELERMLVAAESLGFLKRSRLTELIEERRSRPGIHKLVALLALEPAFTRSELEALFLPISAQAGLNRPLVNHPIRVPGRTKPLLVDFAWPDLRMAVEADSQRFHGDWEQAEVDRDRDQLLALAGWVCHRFVRRSIVEDPAGSADRLRLLTAARRRG